MLLSCVNKYYLLTYVLSTKIISGKYLKITRSTESGDKKICWHDHIGCRVHDSNSHGSLVKQLQKINQLRCKRNDNVYNKHKLKKKR